MVVVACTCMTFFILHEGALEDNFGRLIAIASIRNLESECKMADADDSKQPCFQLKKKFVTNCSPGKRLNLTTRSPMLVAIDMFTWLLMVAHGMRFRHLPPNVDCPLLSKSYKNGVTDNLLDSLLM